ncbi:MAG: prolyl oligopeptidase family serine peptidase [Bacteroidales bacterium]|nr:prolyl oligopeptidase family serine peptidase [Bacteroidales bacterium]
MKHVLFLLLALMVGPLLLAQENESQLPDTSLFEAHHHIEGNDTLPYRLYRSQKADTMTEALPLVIFLHGAGERGNDNCMQLKHCIKYFLDDTVTSRYPFLLIAPQCPNDRRWVDTDWSLLEHTMDSMPTAELRGVMTVLDSLVGVGVVDSTQVYICGISMGGFGTWDALQRWPEKFAAAIAICGGGDPAYAEVMKDIPVYIFHGLLDGVVMPSRSIQMYNALKEVGSKEAILVTYPELGHVCWDEAFSMSGLFEWLFGKRKLSASATED